MSEPNQTYTLVNTFDHPSRLGACVTLNHVRSFHKELQGSNPGLGDLRTDEGDSTVSVLHKGKWVPFACPVLPDGSVVFPAYTTRGST